MVSPQSSSTWQSTCHKVPFETNYKWTMTNTNQENSTSSSFLNLTWAMGPCKNVNTKSIQLFRINHKRLITSPTNHIIFRLYNCSCRGPEKPNTDTETRLLCVTAFQEPHRVKLLVSGHQRYLSLIMPLPLPWKHTVVAVEKNPFRH